MGNKRIPFEPNKLYHVYNHGNAEDSLFRSEDNYHYFLKKYAQYIYPVAETFAYCLMPNHFHLLVQIRPAEELVKLAKNPAGFQNLPGLVSRQSSHFFNAYAKAFNARHGRKGSLFRDGLQRKAVDGERYYTSVIRYIHLNPVRHGFVTRPEDWPHSSFHSLLAAKPTLLLRQEVPDWFGGGPAFEELHRAEPDGQLFTGIEF